MFNQALEILSLWLGRILGTSLTIRNNSSLFGRMTGSPSLLTEEVQAVGTEEVGLKEDCFEKRRHWWKQKVVHGATVVL